MGLRRERRMQAERDAARRAGEASAEAALSDPAVVGPTASDLLESAPDAPDTDPMREDLGGGPAGVAASADAPDVHHSPPSVRVPPDLTAAAFFDVDNTMMMGASIFHFARGLAARNFFSGSDMRGFVWQQVKFRLGGEGSADDVRAHREQALSFVAGQPVGELVELGEEIYDDLMADRIWEGTRASPRCTSTRGNGSGWSPRRPSSSPASSPAAWA